MCKTNQTKQVTLHEFTVKENIVDQLETATFMSTLKEVWDREKFSYYFVDADCHVVWMGKKYIIHIPSAVTNMRFCIFSADNMDNTIRLLTESEIPETVGWAAVLYAQKYHYSKSMAMK